MFMSLILAHIGKRFSLKKIISYSNLKKEGTQALYSLSHWWHNISIIVKEVDKGSGIAVW